MKQLFILGGVILLLIALYGTYAYYRKISAVETQAEPETETYQP